MITPEAACQALTWLDLGYPLLRAFDELVPEGYGDIAEWGDVAEDLDDLP